MTFHVNLLGRQFLCNVKPYFLRKNKIKKNLNKYKKNLRMSSAATVIGALRFHKFLTHFNLETPKRVTDPDQAPQNAVSDAVNIGISVKQSTGVRIVTNNYS